MYGEHTLMEIYHYQRYRTILFVLIGVCLLLFTSSCQNATSAAAVPAAQQKSSTPTPTPTPGQWALPPQPTPILHYITPTPDQATSANAVNTQRPVLAFYYSWYSLSTWSSSTMSDLPTTRYTSNDTATINRQLQEAATAGITGFISSWWGAGDQTDQNFAKLLTLSTTLENTQHTHFASSIYFESDAPALQGTNKIVSNLRYALSHYGSNAHFFHWQGKPVLFFWNPLGNGRTLAQWAIIRQQVDPNHQTIWSAEGVDTNLLSVFDGIHLFSAAYWGIQHKNINAVDQGFRTKINSYNQAHKTHKIWAAGVLPGYDDTRVPGRKGTYVIPRNNGATYRESWTGAISSTPDWITITTFNEWFEGAMIESSIHYGDLYLNITRQYTKQWRG
jgi:Glycosyl hydrolase family 99